MPGALAPDGRSWSTTTSLSYADTYQVVADAQGSDGLAVHRGASFATVRPAVLTSATVGPDLDTVGWASRWWCGSTTPRPTRRPR